jgi:outer membrane protein assembly factor BamB
MGNMWFKRAVTATAVTAAAVAVAAVAPAVSASPPGLHGRAQPAAAITDQDWPAYLYSASHGSATVGPTAITLGNAADLVPAWTFTEQPPSQPDQPHGGFSASPTVADGMVFIGSQTGDFYALDESTGAVVWQRTLDYEFAGHNGRCPNARGVVGTATVAPDPVTGNLTVYVPGARYLYALNAATGALQWKALVGPPGTGSVRGAYYNYASPTVANGRVYMGVSSSCDEPFVRGGVQAFSQQTGKLLHSFWTDPPGRVGASVWSSEAAAKDSVWVTTGDPKYTGAHLYRAYEVVQLNARTLTVRSAWQLHLPQAGDLDFGGSPTLFTGVVHGVATALVGACSKDGRYYALRRDDLTPGPVWSVRVGGAAHTQQGMCLAAGVWNPYGDELYLAGDGRYIGRTYYAGSIRSVNPGTGATTWVRGLSCSVIGTPSLDAATGVIALTTWAPCGKGESDALYLIDAANGSVLATIPEPVPDFAQPVFAGQYLFAADESGQLVAYTPAEAP